jgi:hypothetical protein
MKPETEKQLSTTTKALKSAETYLTQHKKLEEAFTALDAEKEKMEKEHTDVLASAGNVEASRLLGEELTGDTAQNLDGNLMKVRDQQDRLAAARSALEARKKALFGQLSAQSSAANRALSDLTRTIEQELNEELTQAVNQITAIVNRYYALYSGSHYGSLYKRDVFEMRIPSLTDGRNLFKEPARYHPRTDEVVASAWKDDPEAVKLCEQIDGLGRTNQVLQRMEKQMLDARVAV